MDPSPGSGFEATHPGGSAGAVTLSQFSKQGPPGVGVGDGDGDGDGDGVTGVGVGVVWLGHVAPVIEILSMCTPGAATASSEPIRKRNVTVCPARFGPRFITVSM